METKIEFKKATPKSLAYLAKYMRKQDVAEVWASTRVLPLKALQDSVRASKVHCVCFADDVPCLATGVVINGILTGRGTPWLLGTDRILQYKKEFVVETRHIVAEMFNHCDYLSNYVHKKNIVSIEWMKWAGFTVLFDQPIDVRGETFYKFEMRSKSCVTQRL